MRLDEWLAHQAQVHPQPIDLGLERLERVLERLQWRQPPVPVITIAGTNGKGSVAAYLRPRCLRRRATGSALSPRLIFATIASVFAVEVPRSQRGAPVGVREDRIGVAAASR